MLYTLGINCMYHESAACLLRDGALVAMAEEERFNRVKHGKKPGLDNADELPVRAIRHCLRTAGIGVGDVGWVGYSSDPSQRAAATANDPFHDDFVENVKRAPQTVKAMGFRKAEFVWVDHHTAHAASAYYPSGFRGAAVLSIDGIGDTNTTALFHGEGHRLDLLEDVKSPDSIGFLWELVSMFLGFDIYDATKIMGLAAYGDPRRYAEAMRRLIWPTPDGKFQTDREALRFWLLDYDTPSGYFAGLEKAFGLRKRERGEELSQPYQDVAAALQLVTDEVILHLARRAHERTGSENLCLAGGVALNCVTNQQVFEKGPFARLYVQPAAHDAGTALGSAWYIWHHLLGNPLLETPRHAYWGPSYTPEQVEEALQDHQLSYARSDQAEEEVARLLAGGQVVGWFSGRMEMGPRALGNRSLLADPRKANMRDLLNHKVKHREYFRPFAPSVLQEEARGWFQIEKETPAAEFMLMAYPVPEPLREKIPAVIHVDGTSRIQTVSAQTNPRYHRLISAFHRLTGVPLVLNTSFNDSEPIVCSPKDAITTFMKTEIDYLVMEGFIVSKEENRAVVERWRGRSQPAAQELFRRVLAGHRLTRFEGGLILTDGLRRQTEDQVVAIFPDHQFFADELARDKVRGAEVLEIGQGAGALTVALVRAGARQVTALEANPRARAFAGFNALLNRCAGKVVTLNARPGDPYGPVAGRQFDYVAACVLCTPEAGLAEARDQPAAAVYGLRGAEGILRGLNEHLKEGGHAQLVCLAPGDAAGPSLLVELAGRVLPGSVTVKVNPEPQTFDSFVEWMRGSKMVSRMESLKLRLRARADSVTHLHLCVLHFEKGPVKVEVGPSARAYPDWQLPLPTAW